jgi:hypothetical protein
VSALLALALLASPLPVEHRYVVVVGHDGPTEAGRPPLRFADDDAARFYELVAPGAAQAFLLTTFDAESQAVFGPLVGVARAPTPARLEAALAEVRDAIARDEAAGARTTLYFFYAGHGDVDDGEGYVQLDGGRLTRHEFEKDVAAFNADTTHVFVDACKSYFLVAGRGPGGRREPYARPFVGQSDAPGVGYVLSTSNDAESHEWAAISGGIFSHEIRSALVGGADVDGDGVVDYDELAAFVAVANEGVPAPGFRPQIYIRPPPRDRHGAVFAPGSLPGATRLALGPDVAGRLSIGDERGLRYADGNKGAGSPLTIALIGPRRYEVRVGAATYSVEAAGGTVDLGALAPDPETAVAARGEAHRAFEQLFARPFDADVLRGYRLAAGVEAEPPPASERSLAVPVSLIAAGVAAIGGGVALGLEYAGERRAAARAPQADRPGHDDRATAFGWGAVGAFSLGLGAIGAGTWMLAW